MYLKLTVQSKATITTKNVFFRHFNKKEPYSTQVILGSLLFQMSMYLVNHLANLQKVINDNHQTCCHRARHNRLLRN